MSFTRTWLKTDDSISGSNAGPQRHLGRVPSGAGESSGIGHRLPRLPLGQAQGLPVSHPAPTDSGYDPRFPGQGELEDHLRRRVPGEDLEADPNIRYTYSWDRLNEALKSLFLGIFGSKFFWLLCHVV